jgi:hypothetical protein
LCSLAPELLDHAPPLGCVPCLQTPSLAPFQAQQAKHRRAEKRRRQDQEAD